MLPMSARVELSRQILDHGKRSWNKDTDAAGDADVFLAEIVVPLRALRVEGLFEKLHEHFGNYRGLRLIDRVDVQGAVNYDYDGVED
jgi:hypothetical protein